MRNFLLFATTLLMALLANLTLAQPSSAASDATWSGDQISYNGTTFTQDTGDQKHALHAPSDAAAVYVFAPAQASQVQVIFFPKGSDPASSKTAQYYIEPDVKNAKSISIEPKADPPLSATATATASGCNMNGIGWIVCPVSNAIAAGIDTIYGIIATFFVVNPLTSSQHGLYPMWAVFRNFANIAFVIAFMIMIYGQVTGGVISNYTIKKMLPRLVAAALLVNVSYWICAIGIDLSNITGYAIHALFDSLRQTAGAPNSDAATGFAPTWAAITGAVLAGGSGALIGGTALVIASGTWTGFIFLLLGALLPAIFAALVAIAVLAARQALITVFVILSPLAFVAFILPSTHEWFTRWRKTFTMMLVMFPAFSLVFSGSQLAGTLIIQNAGGEKKDLAVVILGMAVQVVPLFITPLLIRLSSGIMSKVADFANNKQKGLFDRTKNWSNTRRAQEQAAGARARAERAKRLGITDGRRRSTHPNRAVRTAQNLRSRANPLDRAYNQEYRNTEREEMMKANQATTAGLFTQTAAGGRVADQNYDAAGLKHHGDNTNYRAYQDRLVNGTTPADILRRQEHHEAHVAKGEGDLYEQSLTNHAERDLQSQINADAALRELKVRSDVDAAHAKFQEANVTAEGTHTFQQEVIGDGTLKNMNNQTVELERSATTLQNTLKSRADQRYERISTDTADPEFRPNLREARMYEAEASDDLKRAQTEWNTLLDGLRSRGADAPTLNGHIERSIAGNMKQLSQDITIEERRGGEFQAEQKVNLAKVLSEDEALRLYAGADTQPGATRVYAKAKSDVVQAAVEEVKVNRTLTSQMTRPQLQKVFYKGSDPDGHAVTDEMRLAAMYELLQEKGSNEDAQEIRDAISKMGMLMDDDGNYYDPQRDATGRVIRDASGRPVLDVSVNRKITDPTESSHRRDWQQFFDDAMKNSSHGMITRSGSNQSEYKSGTSIDDTRQGFMRDILSGKFSAKKVLNADLDELKILLEDLRSNRGEYAKLNSEQKEKVGGTLISSILKLQLDPTVNSQIDERNRGFMNEIAAEVDPRYRINPGARDQKGQFYVNESGALLRRDQVGDAAETTVFTAPLTLGDTVYTDRTIE